MLNLFQELRMFIETIVDWIVLMIVFTFFFFTCNVKEVSVIGHITMLPVPSEPSFAASFFRMLVQDIAPQHLPLIVTSPMTAFVVQAKIAFLLSLFFTLPVFLLRLISYLSPALHKHEMRIIYLLLAPLTVLFALGVFFAYIFIAPATFSLLYGMAGPIGVVPMLDVNEFIGMTISLLFATGVAFTIPVFMVLLTALRVIPSSFWKKNMRYAIILFLVISAIITPDGSGVAMLLLTFPVSFLYGAGTLICMRIEKVRNKKGKAVQLINN